MKLLFSVFSFCFFIAAASAQTTTQKISLPDPNKKVQTVEISCGKCKFGLHSNSCDLAVRIAGKAYNVDGAKIDDFGDAHSDDGFCKAIRKAEVQGEIVNNRFIASYIKLLPEEKKKDGN